MRMLLALMFFAPIAATLAIMAGVQAVTPILMVLSVAAIVGQVFIEKRQREN